MFHIYTNIKKNKGLRGFTVIEVMVVIAILGIIAIVAYPNYDGIRRGNRIYTEARQVKIDLRYAWRIATAQKVDVSVKFYNSNGRYELKNEGTGEFLRKGNIHKGVDMQASPTAIMINSEGRLRNESGFDLTSAGIMFDAGNESIGVDVYEFGGIDLNFYR